jgi:hypothetical protein
MFAKIIGVIIASAIIWSIPEVSGLAAPFLIVALAVVLVIEGLRVVPQQPGSSSAWASSTRSWNPA